MFKRLKFRYAAAIAGVLALPTLAAAAQTDTMACAVSIEYSLNNVTTLTYNKGFEVGVDATFTDDFSTATRFRFFDAFLNYEAGVPTVTIVFDADVSVFNAVDFDAALQVRDQSNGTSTTGTNSFFSSVPGAAGAHRTRYTLTCLRAKN